MGRTQPNQGAWFYYWPVNPPSLGTVGPRPGSSCWPLRADPTHPTTCRIKLSHRCIPPLTALSTANLSIHTLSVGAGGHGGGLNRIHFLFLWLILCLSKLIRSLLWIMKWNEMKCWTKRCYNLILNKNVNFNSMINLFKLSFNNIFFFLLGFSSTFSIAEAVIWGHCGRL